MQKEIEESCTPTEVHETSFFIHFVWGISGSITAATAMISFILIIFHLKHYTRPEQQRYIARILLMAPIYSGNSWLSLRFYWLSDYFDVLRDCYEAYVILSFYYLLIDMLGGYEHCKDIIEKKNRVFESYHRVVVFMLCQEGAF